MSKAKNISKYEITIETNTDFMKEFLEKSIELAVIAMQTYNESKGRTKSKIEIVKTIVR